MAKGLNLEKIHPKSVRIKLRLKTLWDGQQKMKFAVSGCFLVSISDAAQKLFYRKTSS